MNIQILAGILLVGRLAAIVFTIIVIRLQVQLLRTKTNPELQDLRKLLLTLSVIVFAGNMIPIMIDVVGLTGNRPGILGIYYAFSNNLTALLSSILLWIVYRYSERNGGTP